MNDAKYIGLDVHQAAISVAVLDSAGKLVMEAIVETKAETILQCMHGLSGSLHVTLEEGTWASWLHDLLKPHVSRVLVSDPRKNDLGRDGNQNDRRNARELAELKNIFKGAATWAASNGGPFKNFYRSSRGAGMKPHMARLTLARKIANSAAKAKGTYLRDKFYRRKARRGYRRAAVAITHKILVAIYHMLSHQSRTVLRERTGVRDQANEKLE